MRGIFSFLSGVMTGALVGAAAALLMAPTSGDKFRDDVKARMDSTFSDLKESVASERKRLEEELDMLRHGEIRLD